MPFPSELELKAIRKKLAKAEPSRMLPKNASKAEFVKFKLCEKFVIYLQENKISQIELALKLGVHPSRVNEIVKYKINLYTVDRLLNLAERLKLSISINVA